jgi:hypothetical protein
MMSRTGTWRRGDQAAAISVGMKAVGYALTTGVVLATYFCRDEHKQYLDGCYTQRPDKPVPTSEDEPGSGLADLRVDSLDEGEEQGWGAGAQIHWGSGLPCFLVFYAGQLMLALAYRGQALPLVGCTGAGDRLSRSWRIALEVVGAHIFSVVVYAWAVLPMGLRMENYAAYVVCARARARVRAYVLPSQSG